MTTISAPELRDRIDRNATTATTYLRKASAFLWALGPDVPPVRPVSTRYWDLLDQALDTALDIVEALPDEFFVEDEVQDYFGIGGDFIGGRFNTSDTPLENAEKVVAEIRKRREAGNVLRRIKALEEVAGRTPEEAAAYLAKAADLRREHGIDPR